MKQECNGGGGGDSSYPPARLLSSPPLSSCLPGDICSLTVMSFISACVAFVSSRLVRESGISCLCLISDWITDSWFLCSSLTHAPCIWLYPTRCLSGFSTGADKHSHFWTPLQEHPHTETQTHTNTHTVIITCNWWAAGQKQTSLVLYKLMQQIQVPLTDFSQCYPAQCAQIMKKTIGDPSYLRRHLTSQKNKITIVEIFNSI